METKCGRNSAPQIQTTLTYENDESEYGRAGTVAESSQPLNLATDISQIKLMLSSLTIGQNKEINEQQGKYLGDEKIKPAKNILEISHPDVSIVIENDFIKVTCIPCSSYLEAPSNSKMFSNKLTFGNGILYTENRKEKLLSGGNQCWYNFKSSLQEHLGCNSERNGGKFHFKSKQYEVKMKKSEEKLLHANIAVVSAGIEACKVKTIARSFESLVAFLSFCGVDVGNIGHGRNQFPDIINAVYQYQANTFQNAICHQLNKEKSIDKYFMMPWDPSHWLDIVMEYAQEKDVVASAFLKRLVQRSNKL